LGTLNSEIQSMMTSTDQMVASKYYNVAKTKGIDTARKQLDQELGSGEEGRNVELAFNDLIAQTTPAFLKTPIGDVATPWEYPSLEDQDVGRMTRSEAKTFATDIGSDVSRLLKHGGKIKEMSKSEAIEYLLDDVGVEKYEVELFYQAIKAYQ